MYQGIIFQRKKKIEEIRKNFYRKEKASHRLEELEKKIV